jgi:hypothetical protein
MPWRGTGPCRCAASNIAIVRQTLAMLGGGSIISYELDSTRMQPQRRSSSDQTLATLGGGSGRARPRKECGVGSSAPCARKQEALQSMAVETRKDLYSAGARCGGS